MRLVHFSDLHLGIRQYARSTSRGMNQREADVAQAFSSVVDKTIEIAPDVIVIGGDVFHTVRPGNTSILHANREFSRLVGALPQTEIVMIAGNHDQPRVSDTGCILGLFSTLGIRVSVDTVQRFSLRNGNVSVLAVPDGISPRPKFEPDASAKYNVLLLHGEMAGLIRKPPALAAHDVKLEEIAAEWDYVALGHYHVHQQIAERAFYSGSIEYTSSDIWKEVREELAQGIGGKGIVEYDLDEHRLTFHEIKRARRVIDLAEIDATGKTSKEVSDMILAQADSIDGGIDGQIVRQIVQDIEKHVIRDLDHRVLRVLKARALHYLLDPRRPDAEEIARGNEPRKQRLLPDILREFLGSRELTPGIDRSELVELGMHYLAEVEEKEETTQVTEAAA